MAFDITVNNGLGECIGEDSVSGGVFARWRKKADELSLPILYSIYDDAFYEGLELESKLLAKLRKECEVLYNHLKSTGESRKIVDVDGVVKESNLEALHTFIKQLDKAIQFNGSVSIS